MNCLPNFVLRISVTDWDERTEHVTPRSKYLSCVCACACVRAPEVSYFGTSDPLTWTVSFSAVHGWEPTAYLNKTTSLYRLSFYLETAEIEPQVYA
jgi:hypothetical protein